VIKYQEFIPHIVLRDYVKRFWILENEYTAEDSVEEVTPDACVILARPRCWRSASISFVRFSESETFHNSATMTCGQVSFRHSEIYFCRKIRADESRCLHAKFAAFVNKLAALVLPFPLLGPSVRRRLARLRIRDNIVTPGCAGGGLVCGHENDSQKQK
jgi:hypothetical protein